MERKAMTFSIPNMSCGHCVTAITSAIHALNPVADIAADTTTKQVDVSSTAAETDLRAALSEAGYAPA